MGINRGNAGSGWEGLRRSAVILFGLVLGLAALELLARVAGTSPYTDAAPYGTSTLFASDSVLGYVPRTGLIELPLDGDTSWVSVRHNENGDRATEPSDNYLNSAARREVWFVGGSETYRIDLADRETLPWKTYDRLKEMSDAASVVRNMAVPGYTDSQVYLQIRQVIDWGERPSVVIVPTHYRTGSLHPDGKYELARVLGQTDATVPVVHSTAPLQVDYRSIRYRPLALSRQLAIANVIDGWRRQPSAVNYRREMLESTVSLLLSHEIGVIVLNSTGRSAIRSVPPADVDGLFDLAVENSADVDELSARLAELIIQMERGAIN